MFFENETIKKNVFEKLEAEEDAPHDIIIIVLTNCLLQIKRFWKKLPTIQRIKRKKKLRKKNLIRLDSAKCVCDRGQEKNLDCVFQEVAHHSDEMEPTHGMIWWKLKSMMTRKKVSDHMKNVARELVSVYHESRLGGLGMKERLEKFFLTMPDKK
jgi:hypothetical protein